MADSAQPPSRADDSSPPDSSAESLLPRRGAHRVQWTERSSASPSPSRPTSRSAGRGDGKTLEDQLLEALTTNDLPKFEELVNNRRCNKNYKFGKPYHGTCLEIACRLPDRGEFVRVLLQCVKPNVNKVIPEPIHYAAQKGHDDSLRALLSDKRTKVYAQNSKGQTALHVACANVTPDRADEYANCIKLLVPKMAIADLNKPDCNGFTAFHTLVRGTALKSKSSRRRGRSPDAGGNEAESSEAGKARRRHFVSTGREGEDEQNSEREKKKTSVWSSQDGGNEDESSEGAQEAGKPAAARQDHLDDDDDDDEESKVRERLAELLLRLTQGALDVDSVRTKGRTARDDVELRYKQLVSKLPARRIADARGKAGDPHCALADALRDDRLELFRALLQQTDPDGNPALDPNHVFGPPLHATCLEMACARDDADGELFVQALLEAGADPNVPNKLNEKYPIHIACEKGHFKELDALLRYSIANVEVNCGDKYGNTPLHCTVDRVSDDKRREVGRRKCLELLLEQPQLDVTRMNNTGNTALLLAVEDGNKSFIKTFLSAKTHFPDIDLTHLSFETNGKPLRIHLMESFPQLADLLQRPSDYSTLRIRREKAKDLFELLNPTREDEFVQLLKTTRPRTLAEMNDKKFTLLQRAAYYGMAQAARALLAAGVGANGTFAKNMSPPGVIACLHRHKDVLEALMENSDFNVNAADSKGNTGLHYAVKADDNLEMVVLLLRKGADIYVRNKLGKSPFGREQVESLLDQCVKTNGKNALDEEYELIFDYRLLAPAPHKECVVKNQSIQFVPGDGGVESLMGNGVAVIRSEGGVQVCHKMVSEMDFLNMMSKDESLCSLIDHPVTKSFLLIKWNRLRLLSFFNLGTFILFMIFLNIFIILATHNAYLDPNDLSKDGRSTGKGKDLIVICAITSFFCILMALREFTQFVLDARKYIKSPENYLDLGILISSFTSLSLPFTNADSNIVRSINVVTIMLTSVELLILLGRITRLAKYIEMLKVVIKNYLLPLLSYSVILVAFGLSFHSLCYESSVKEFEKAKNRTQNGSCCQDDPPDFHSWDMAIVMPLVMMIGEVDFKSIPERSAQSVILFVLFVLLVTVVLLNLLTGLAVSDTQKIEDAAQQLRMQSRVGVVLRSERIFVSMYNTRCFAARWCLPECVRRWLRQGLLFPGAALEGREGRVKPNQTGEISLGSGGESERRSLVREALDRATLIISRRGAAASRALTLADVDARVLEVLKALKTMEERWAPVGRASEARDSRLASVFSEPDDYEPQTPGPAVQLRR